MQSEELTSAVVSWRGSAEALLALADPLAAAVDADPDDLEQQADDLADAIISDGDRAIAELESAQADDPDAPTQLAAFIAANLAVTNDLLAAGEAEADAFDGDPGPGFAYLADQVQRPGFGAETDAIEIPDSVTEEFDEVELAAGEEIWELARSSAVHAVGVPLVDSLGQLLAGVAGQAFGEVKDAIRGLWAWAKKAAVKVAKWITDRILALLPASMRDKLTEAWDSLIENLTDQAPELIGNALGRLVGRPTAEDRWRHAVSNGYDTSAALAAVPQATAGAINRIGWIGTGRGVIEKFAGLALTLQAAQPWGPIAYGCLVASAFAFVVWQLDDGIDDIGALAPTA